VSRASGGLPVDWGYNAPRFASLFDDPRAACGTCPCCPPRQALEGGGLAADHARDLCPNSADIFSANSATRSPAGDGP